MSNPLDQYLAFKKIANPLAAPLAMSPQEASQLAQHAQQLRQQAFQHAAQGPLPHLPGGAGDYGRELSSRLDILERVGKHGIPAPARGFKHHLRDAAMAAGAAAVLGGGIAMLSGAAQKVYLAATKKSRFESMLKSNPDLHEHQQANPQQFDEHYNSLYRMNPRFASDPVVAGAYMRQMSMHPSTAGKVVVESLSSIPRDRGPSMQVGGKVDPRSESFQPSATFGQDLY